MKIHRHRYKATQDGRVMCKCGDCKTCERGQSTYCGSMCEQCLEEHCKQCEVCNEDFG